MKANLASFIVFAADQIGADLIDLNQSLGFWVINFICVHLWSMLYTSICLDVITLLQSDSHPVKTK